MFEEKIKVHDNRLINHIRILNKREDRTIGVKFVVGENSRDLTGDEQIELANILHEPKFLKSLAWNGVCFNKK